MPVNETDAAAVDCPLITMLSTLATDPAMVGAKVTEALPLLLAPMVRLVGATEKGALANRETVIDAALLFVTVIGFAWLVWPTATVPKSSEAGLAVIAGPPDAPDPLKLIVAGDAGSLLAIVREPLKEDADAGVKRTVTVADCPAGTLKDAAVSR